MLFQRKSILIKKKSKKGRSPITTISMDTISMKMRPRNANMSSFMTPNRHGYSVRFSPFDANRLVVAASQHYGFSGGGTLFALELTANGSIVERGRHQWMDGLFDVAWSEHDRNMVVTASGDGSLQIWDTELESNAPIAHMPKAIYREHTKEVYSVDWSPSPNNRIFLSGSWDKSIKLWDPLYSASMRTYNGHNDFVFNAKFSPGMANVFASVGADGYLKLWDVLEDRPKASLQSHQYAEVLSCDWNKSDQNILATGASDGLIKGWDIRSMTTPIFELQGCDYAVRRVQFSPHDANILASVSYDHSSRIWNWRQSSEAIETIMHHSEFNYGLDWNRLSKNQLADCGWDSLVHVYTPRSLS